MIPRKERKSKDYARKGKDYARKSEDYARKVVFNYVHISTG